MITVQAVLFAAAFAVYAAGMFVSERVIQPYFTPLARAQRAYRRQVRGE